MVFAILKLPFACTLDLRKSSFYLDDKGYSVSDSERGVNSEGVEETEEVLLVEI
jgi:hypothetical protein